MIYWLMATTRRRAARAPDAHARFQRAECWARSFSVALRSMRRKPPRADVCPSPG